MYIPVGSCEEEEIPIQPDRSTPNQINMEHEDLRERLRKTLYYGRLPSLDRPSLAVTELTVELLEEVAPREFGKVDMFFASELSREVCASPCSVVVAMLYMRRLQKRNPAYLHQVSSSELLLVAMMVASKYLYDEGELEEPLNEEWSNSAHIPVKDLNQLERSFLSAIDWKVFVSRAEFWNALMDLEARIAWRRCREREGCTYTDLNVLMSDGSKFNQLITALLFTVCEALAVCCVSYCACVLPLLSAPIALQIAQPLAISTLSLAASQIRALPPAGFSRPSLPTPLSLTAAQLSSLHSSHYIALTNQLPSLNLVTNENSATVSAWTNEDSASSGRTNENIADSELTNDEFILLVNEEAALTNEETDSFVLTNEKEPFSTATNQREDNNLAQSPSQSEPALSSIMILEWTCFLLASSINNPVASFLSVALNPSRLSPRCSTRLQSSRTVTSVDSMRSKTTDSVNNCTCSVRARRVRATKQGCRERESLENQEDVAGCFHDDSSDMFSYDCDSVSGCCDERLSGKVGGGFCDRLNGCRRGDLCERLGGNCGEKFCGRLGGDWRGQEDDWCKSALNGADDGGPAGGQQFGSYNSFFIEQGNHVTEHVNHSLTPVNHSMPVSDWSRSDWSVGLWQPRLVDVMG